MACCTPPYSKGGTTDCQETRGKKRAEGIVGGYKRPAIAGYHKEGTDPHRQTPNRNGDPIGDEEGDAKTKDINDSGDGIKTHTGGPNNEGDDSANTIVMCTKPLKKGNDQRLRSTSFQRSGTEMQ